MHLKKLLILVCLIILAFSCRREIAINSKAFSTAPASRRAYTDYKPTLKDLFFKGPFSTAKDSVVSLKNGDYTRLAFPYPQARGTMEVNRYLLFEINSKGHILNNCYIISNKKIDAGNLFFLPMKRDSILYYEFALFPNSRDTQRITNLKLVAKINGVTYDADALQREALPCEGENTPAECIDWFWVIYNEDTGEVILETYLYTTCENGCNNGGGGGGEDEEEEPLPDLYICASSFNFQSQGQGSITNVARTWGLMGTYITPQNTFTATFGFTTTAPSDAVFWNLEWAHINATFPYLVQSHDIWLRPDNSGRIHLMFSRHAQKEIAAAAADYASDNQRNPKNILALPNGAFLYKQKFKSLYLQFIRTFIPGATGDLINSYMPGCTQAIYSSTPCQ